MTAPETEIVNEALPEPVFAEQVVEPEPFVEAPIPSGAPYRALPELGTPLALSSSRRARPVIGPALTTYALLLWSYVVFGQFTTTLSASTPLGEGKAFFGVFAVTSATWLIVVRRSQRTAPTTGPRLVPRAVAVAALAALLFFVTVFVATMVGSFSTHLDVFIPFVLVLLCLGAVIYGRRLLVPEPTPRTQNERSVLVGLWMTVVLVTFIAGVDLALNG